MIKKHKDYENGYYFITDRNQSILFDQTSNDLENIKKSYKEIKCVICNKATAKNFKITNGYNIITINNKLNDGCFFINCIK